MDSPNAPIGRGTFSTYGTSRKAINRLAFAGALTLALVGGCGGGFGGAFGGAARGESAPQRGLPPLTAQTARSGGAIDPLQAALAFDAVDLEIELLPDRQTILGLATLTFTARAPLDTLLLDLDRNLPVRTISIGGTALKPAAWSNAEGRLRIALPRPAQPGERIVARIRYGGTPHVAVNPPWDDGFVWTKTKDGKPWIASTQEGYGCDLFWPCLDFPTGEPALADLHIIVPRGLAAPANGVLIGRETLPRKRTSWHWRVKHPNTYALALTVGPYDLLSDAYHSRFGNLIRLNYWYLPPARQKASALFAEFAPTLDFFEQMIGPYPFGDEKLGVVETPYLGMEHQTINGYGNNYKKSPEGFDWLFQHELSHEWFGNQLTAGDWDDYWLHEGFAQYMQPLYGEWREGKARYLAMLDGYRNRIENRSPLVSGRPRTEEEVYESAQGGPGTDIYYKGAWVLHTLRGLIGDKAFFASVRRLVYGRPDPAPGNFAPRYGSTAEFEALATAESGQDLGWFFDAYVRRAALPELVATPEPGGRRLEWRAGGPFPMPVEAEVDGARVTVAMPGGVGHLAVPAGAHVVLDPDAKILKRSTAIEAYQAGQREPAR